MTCPRCGGDGTVPVLVNDGTLYYEDREACPDCHGTGEVDDGDE
jgi:DnaJ-class molecular chaperone